MPEVRAVERRIVTVLFADLVGFTELSERLDAEDVALVQDAYFDAVRQTIGRHGGQLEKFIGDAAMAVFGIPRSRDDDAERAIRAGLALVGAVERLGASVGLDDGALAVRVGVNSGEAFLGEASAERGPVTGDVVNTAARLQAVAAAGGVVVGEVTAFAVADAVDLVPLEPLSLKGKAEPVRAATVAGLFPERSRERALGSLRAPTLGRGVELGRLEAAIGAGSVAVAVVAPPGTGKTRILQELATRAAGRGAAVLRARVRPEALGPFEPLRQLVHAAGGVEGLRRNGQTVPAPRLEALTLALRELELDAEVVVEHGERDVVFAAWREALDILTEGQPAVWLVEDVHWASGDFLSFLSVAADAPRSDGRLVIATARPSFLELETASGRGWEVLHLAALDERLTEELVGALVGDALPAVLTSRLVAAADGNPLFVEELLRLWADVGVLRHDGDTWVLAVEPDSVSVPSTVQAIYAAQLDDLPEAARTAARRASVAGRRFPRSACEPLGIERADAALGTLSRRALLDGPQDDELFGASYTYRHALLRDAGYASLARRERAVLHLRLANWLAGLPDSAGGLAEVIGRHYAAAAESAPELAPSVDGRSRQELREHAARWFEQAATVALRLAAWESAAALAQRALEVDDVAASLVRARRLELRAEATANTVGADEAIPLLEAALEGYRAELLTAPAEARAGLASAGLALGTLLRAQTWFAAAELLADELLDEIGPEADSRSQAQLLMLRAYALLNVSDDYARAADDATRALELARSAGDRGLELDVRHALAQIAAEQDGAAAESVWASIEELARSERRWSSVAASLRARGLARVDDDPSGALGLLATSADVCAAHGLVEAGLWCEHGRTEVAFATGAWAEALEVGLNAVDAGERHAFHRVVVRLWFVLLPIARSLGRRDLIERAYPRFAERRGREPDSPYARIVTTAAHLEFARAGLEPTFVPEVESRLGAFDGAHAGPSWLAGIRSVVGAWIAAGELEGARAALDRMGAANGSTRLARATESMLRARLEHAGGELGLARDAAHRALELLDGAAPWWRLGALGELHGAGGGNEVTRREAEEIRRHLGLPG